MCFSFCRYIDFTFFFFFSSRRRHTRCLSDWSSDVCSSDLADLHELRRAPQLVKVSSGNHIDQLIKQALPGLELVHVANRSEERRVGKECRSRWSPYH